MERRTSREKFTDKVKTFRKKENQGRKKERKEKKGKKERKEKKGKNEREKVRKKV